jgi:hypothetical protein
MEVRTTGVTAIEGAVDMRLDPAVDLYTRTVVDLGEDWGRTVVLSPQGEVVMGKRVFDRAVKSGAMSVRTARVDVSPEDARMLRLADFAESDGLVMLMLERILSTNTEAA